MHDNVKCAPGMLLLFFVTLPCIALGSTSFSEKGLHFCDAAFSRPNRKVKEEGWYVEEAMRLISNSGTALSNCMPNDQVPKMYNLTSIGNLSGECNR